MQAPETIYSIAFLSYANGSLAQLDIHLILLVNYFVQVTIMTFIWRFLQKDGDFADVSLCGRETGVRYAMLIVFFGSIFTELIETHYLARYITLCAERWTAKV
jgi:hypothetical protein